MTEHLRNQLILQRAITKLLMRHGSYGKISKAVGISRSYLRNMHLGIRTNPSETILNKLRIHKHIVYKAY